MNDIVIRVEHLSKKYHIGRRQTYRTLRDTLASVPKLPLQLLRSIAQKEGREQSGEPEIWALKDLSFEVRRGEVLGIIGRNGAGKSTLLKILSKITLPTEGRIERYGRVGSLLEVGTGFHPELTGRENVYLNGATLGMKKAEIDRKFDQIVAFAEINQFLDTPVKHYSSGMYVRLAFAVAAHLETEILIVDEVLAVGDTAFQQKCLGKMDDVVRGGRTVLFVSHSMASMQALCNRGMILQHGKLLQDAEMSVAVKTYLQMLEKTAMQDLRTKTERAGAGAVRLDGVEIRSDASDSLNTLITGSPARFVFHLTNLIPKLSCVFTIYNQLGLPLVHFSSAVHSAEDYYDTELGANLVCHIDELALVPGRYRINVALSTDEDLQDHVEAAAVFDVEQGLFRGRPISGDHGYGNTLLPHHWVTPWKV